MFGDPITNPKGWEILSLDNIITQINNGYNPSKKDFGTGIPFVTVNNLYDGLSIDYDSLDKVNFLSMLYVSTIGHLAVQNVTAL